MIIRFDRYFESPFAGLLGVDGFASLLAAGLDSDLPSLAEDSLGLSALAALV
jgi:hypothetical protein